MGSVSWTRLARSDLREVRNYIARRSPAYAAGVVARITAAPDLLRRFPRLGRVVPEYNNELIRELIVDSYRIIYRLRGDHVRISAVSHSSRDLLSHLGPEPWDFR
jgi:toxin ParE1/3/4